MINLFWVGVVWCVLAYPLSFIVSYRSSKLSWFFTVTFWLALGYLITETATIEAVVIGVIIFVVTAVLVSLGRGVDE